LSGCSNNSQEATQISASKKPNNILQFSTLEADELKATTIFLEHGIGTKSIGFYHIVEYIDIYLVEGSYKYDRLKELYPKHESKLEKVGFSKFDPIANLDDKTKEALYKRNNLDKNRKTILYAPTFFPSSIEKMSDKFADDFKEYNIIVKPHYLSLERKRYNKQQKKFAKWATYENCTIMPVKEYNLVPFLILADVMISDESAAIFEFASLNKPVVINRFLKLRLSYYLSPKKLLKRMDKGIDEYRKIGENPTTYQEMVKVVHQELQDGKKFEAQRKSMAKDICGITDGKVSQRIVDIIKDLSA